MPLQNFKNQETHGKKIQRFGKKSKDLATRVKTPILHKISYNKLYKNLNNSCIIKTFKNFDKAAWELVIVSISMIKREKRYYDQSWIC